MIQRDYFEKLTHHGLIMWNTCTLCRFQTVILHRRSYVITIPH